MKQMNREAIMKLCSEISKKEGDGSVYSLGSKNGILKIPRWGTGLPELDNIIGGGMPKGRTIEILFTFHNVSINSLLQTRWHQKIHNLHSIMYLLIQKQS